MADVVSPEKRSQMMAGIRAKNTRPELALRQAMHRLGFRYRLHAKHLPGHPDIVLPKYRAVVLVHGCFWHGHGCRLFKLPSTRAEFWSQKIERNRANDALATSRLLSSGWRVAVVWECSIRSRRAQGTKVAEKLADWLRSQSQLLELAE